MTVGSSPRSRSDRPARQAEHEGARSSTGKPGRENDPPAGLDWSAFLRRYFPGRRRHDLEALKAYEAYRSAAVP
jgi:hypothetical protein